MSAKSVIERWVEHFNGGDLDAIMTLYAEDASLHVVFGEPVEGRAAIRAMFEQYFGAAKLHCLIRNVIEGADGQVVLEWEDKVGLPGCNIYQVEEGRIRAQRNYFDQVSFFKLNGLEMPQF